MRKLTIMIAASAALAALTSYANAESMIGDPEAGFTFAKQQCAECHLVEPEWVGSFGSPAKSFAEIGSDPKTTEMSLKVFLRTPHIAMPNFILTEQQTEDVVAYILSLEATRQD